MKIVSLAAENVKRLVAVEITPAGNMVQITGKNGAGKTSVLDAIWWALAGAGNVQAAPIRKGEKSARIRLDLGEIIVTRTFKKSEKEDSPTTAITVENADGARFPSPQRMLDDLLGTLSFDPLAFARMLPREQFDALRRFVPGVDFDAIDAANKADYATRTDVNRRWKQTEARAAAITVPPTSDEPLDEAALVDELERAGKRNAAVGSALAAKGARARSVTQYRIEADHLEERAATLRAAALAEEASPLPEVGEPVNVAAIRARIEKAHEAAGHRAKLDERERLRAEADALETESAALSLAMEQREEAKRAAVAAAKMPVPGLGLADGIVTLDGVPFEQASDAEKLKVSVALAMASDPKLRVVRVRDGSLLDADSLRILGEMAETFDMQVWIERVDDSGKVGFVIEDGHVKEATP